MKGYWLIHATAVSDPSANETYNRLWKPIAEKYGARINAHGTEIIHKEARDSARVVTVEFPSYAIAKACYEDPAYQEALEYALKASRRDLLILEGELA
ncbi:DUF1330 domain-containing protein [Acuticoccus kandeliae]|uniref:DUF1330 domain-containing protein n=1 Tax=Acuticoccus kandeliae TaxID=2073160 RepID=UPI000D3EC1E6|nr:DUF1330 domain-containing protein [Acuticoccus kandeliae]